ncbi:hypothetical protein PV350_13970 [Streptomyces sp. PA03-6a]|nr:hypothetical protein [Streptomyces sp. PA03-6a]
MNTTTDSTVGAAMEMAADCLLDQLAGMAPHAEQWGRTLDCGTMRVRIRVEVEPTGLTAEQAAAAVVASDLAEQPESRAAARVVLAGGPSVGEALNVLARSGPWLVR